MGVTKRNICFKENCSIAEIGASILFPVSFFWGTVEFLEIKIGWLPGEEKWNIYQKGTYWNNFVIYEKL